jgi:translocation and assembly module TamA
MADCVYSPAYARVEIKGIADEAYENTKLMLALEKEPCDAPQWKIKSLFKKSGSEIDQALRALGYYHATVTHKLTFKQDCWQADFAVNPGPRVIVTDIKIDVNGDAKEDADLQALLHKLPVKTGDPLHHGRYEGIKSKLESLAMEKGYLNAAFSEKKLLIDKQNNTAQIRLVFNSGQRLIFGDIRIQQDALDDGLVQKYIPVKAGEFYSSDALAKTYNNLAQSGYFDSIDIRSDLENIKDNRVPIVIQLNAKPKMHYAIGLGFDTDIGPLINASLINRRINRYGHFLTANLDLSPVLSTADIEYNIPLENPISDVFSFGGWLKREDTSTFQSMSATLSARLKRAFANSWRQTLFLDWTYEDFKSDSNSGKTLLLVPGGSWLISVADNPVRPSKGYRIELEAKGSYENPISDVSFIQANLSATWLQSFGFGGKFIGRTMQGATWVDGITRLPTSYRFYAGGINSIRGYAYKELGPKDANGDIEGGQFLSVVSAEYEQAVLENWGVAAFLDSGNAFNLDSLQVKTGVGLGVRWYSPVGPVRLDFAVPLNNSDSSFQIHFATGSRL